MIYNLASVIPPQEISYQEAYKRIEGFGSFLLTMDVETLKAAVSTTRSGFFQLVVARFKILFTCGFWVYDQSMRDSLTRQVIAVNSRAMNLFQGGKQDVSELLRKISRLKYLVTIYESEEFYDESQINKNCITRSLDSLNQILSAEKPDEVFLKIMKDSKLTETFSPLYPCQKIPADENYNDAIVDQSVFISHHYDGFKVRVGPKHLRDRS